MPTFNERNTPTCVGKTRQHPKDDGKHQKHPHMRGEDLPTSRPLSCNMETPPHAWGRLNYL